MSWGVKTTCFKGSGVSLGGSGVSIGGVRSLRVYHMHYLLCQTGSQCPAYYISWGVVSGGNCGLEMTHPSQAWIEGALSWICLYIPVWWLIVL